jgi:trimeric autotransporter adhesin
VALGDAALDSNVSGGSNVAIGANALTANTADLNTAVGYQALKENTTGTNNVAIGASSLDANTTASNNVAVGIWTLTENTTGANNVAIGREALQANTTASNNTAVGYQAGYSNTTATHNTFIGRGSGYSTTTGGDNVALGSSALYTNAEGTSNTSIGYSSMYYNTSGTNNVALGKDALQNNTTANYNTAVGYRSGFLKTTGDYNTFVGTDSGYAMTTGSKNTIVGVYNGNQGGLDIRTSDNYIVLSDGDGTPQAHFEPSGNFVVKRSANSSLQAVGCYNDTTANATNMHILAAGNIVRSTSSRKYKTDIQGADHGLDELMQLRSVTYKGTGNHDSDQLLGGLIAEEVHDAGLTEFVQYNDDGEPDALAYGNMVSLCIKAIQEQQATITALTARITALEGA